MEIQRLGPYFIDFSKLAKNDGSINEGSDEPGYSETLAKIPDPKRRGRVGEDHSIDFYEYIEAIQAFSPADINSDEYMILNYSESETKAISYFNSSEDIKGELWAEANDMLQDPHWDIRERGVGFFRAIHKPGTPEELRKKVRAIMDDMLQSGSSYDAQTGIEFYKTLFPLESSEALRKEIRDKIEPLLKFINDKSEDGMTFGQTIGFYESIYQLENTEAVRKEIRDIIVPSLKHNNRGVRHLAIGFFATIYQLDTSKTLREEIRKMAGPLLLISIYKTESSETIRKDMRGVIETLLKDSSWDARDEALTFFGELYKPEVPDALRKEILDMIAPLFKDRDNEARSNAFHFFEKIYGAETSEALKRDIRNKIGTMIRDSDPYIRSNVLWFFRSLYTDKASEELKNEIRNRTAYHYKDIDRSIRKAIIDFYESIYPGMTSDALRKEIRDKIGILTQDTDLDVRMATIEFYRTLYPQETSEAVRKEIRDTLGPLIKDGDKNIRISAVEFFGSIYPKETSEAVRKEIRDILGPLIKDGDKNVRISAVEFFGSIYPKETSEAVRKEIKDKVFPLLKDGIPDVRIAALGFYMTIYRVSTKEEKECIKNELKWMIAGVGPESLQELNDLLVSLFSGRDLYAEYKRTRNVAVFVLCLSADKLKELDGQIADFISDAINILNVNTPLRIKMAIEFNLVSLLKEMPQGLKDKICARIFDYIRVNRTSEVSMFLQSLLRIRKDSVPDAYKAELQKIISSVLPKTPPYEQILREGKGSIKVLICINGGDIFNSWLSNDCDLFSGYKLVENDGKGKYVYKRPVVINGRSINMIIEMHAKKTWEEYGKILNSGISDNDTDMIIFSAHAAGEIPRIFSQGRTYSGKKEKIVMINACWSTRYYSKIQYVHPGFQFITTEQQTTASDGCPILKVLLDTITEKGSWQDVRERLKASKGQLTSYSGSFVLPDDERYLQIRDSDGDSIPDEKDGHFNLSVSDVIHKEPYNFELRPGWDGQPEVFPYAEVEASIQNNHFIKPFLLENRALFIETINDSPYQNPGWFEPPSWDETFLSIDTKMQQGSDIPLAKLRFNAGYAHCVDEWLGVMTIAELHKYLSLNYKLDEKDDKKVVRKHEYSEGLNGEEKRREFKLIAHYLASAYSEYSQGNKELLSRIWNKAKEKYNLPSISLEEAILVVGSEGYINENIVTGTASPALLKKVDDFFASFK